MNTERLLAEIRDANLGYLTLAQKLIVHDMGEAVASLGISEQSAEQLVRLSPEQLTKLASGSTLINRFRIDDDTVWALLTSHRLPGISSSAAADNARPALALSFA